MLVATFLLRALCGIGGILALAFAAMVGWTVMSVQMPTVILVALAIVSVCTFGSGVSLIGFVFWREMWRL